MQAVRPEKFASIERLLFVAVQHGVQLGFRQPILSSRQPHHAASGLDAHRMFSALQNFLRNLF